LPSPKEDASCQRACGVWDPDDGYYIKCSDSGTKLKRYPCSGDSLSGDGKCDYTCPKVSKECDELPPGYEFADSCAWEEPTVLKVNRYCNSTCNFS